MTPQRTAHHSAFSNRGVVTEGVHIGNSAVCAVSAVVGPGDPSGSYGQTMQAGSPDNRGTQKAEISLKVAESGENPITKGVFANFGGGKISSGFYRLGKIAEAIAAGADLTPEERAAAVEALRSISLVLVPTKPGQRSASTRMAQEGRDRLIRGAVAEFFPTLPAAIAAEQLAQRLARYRLGPDWQRDRTAAGITYRATLRGHCWAILQAVDRPLSARRVREILATS